VPWFYVGSTLFVEPVNGYTPNARALLGAITGSIARDRAAHIPTVLPVFVNGWKLNPANLAWVVTQLRRHYPVTVISTAVLGASIVASLHPGTTWKTLALAGVTGAHRVVRVRWTSISQPPTGEDDSGSA
jgi:hypothetical protein